MKRVLLFCHSVCMLPWHEACSGVVQPAGRQASREAGRAEPWDRSQEAPGPPLASARVPPTNQANTHHVSSLLGHMQRYTADVALEDKLTHTLGDGHHVSSILGNTQTCTYLPYVSSGDNRPTFF